MNPNEQGLPILMVADNPADRTAVGEPGRNWMRLNRAPGNTK